MFVDDFCYNVYESSFISTQESNNFFDDAFEEPFIEVKDYSLSNNQTKENILERNYVLEEKKKEKEILESNNNRHSIIDNSLIYSDNMFLFN